MLCFEVCKCEDWVIKLIEMCEKFDEKFVDLMFYDGSKMNDIVVW